MNWLTGWKRKIRIKVKQIFKEQPAGKEETAEAEIITPENGEVAEGAEPKEVKSEGIVVEKEESLLEDGEAQDSEIEEIAVVEEVEEPEEVVERVEEAMQYVDKERITLHPDCGFAPSVQNPMDLDEAYQKLSAMCAAAALLRERYG